MSLENNYHLMRGILELLRESVPVKFGVNKENELTRLAYEICLRDNVSPETLFDEIGMRGLVEQGRGGLFHNVKRRLLWKRYPLFRSGDDPGFLPLKISEDDKEYPAWNGTLAPDTIFVEKSEKNKEWTKRFLEKFPGAGITEINSFKEGVNSLPRPAQAELYNNRHDKIFLIRNKDAFIKICPCTKGYKRCGYWILNTGFGCPIDCSYCFLQSYSNSPGLILPSNIEEYTGYIERFDKEVKVKTRIGTGEFTDSLALDKYTGYTDTLIPVFKKTKNLVLELKTKVTEIDHIFRYQPGENVVISWSMNTPDMAERYEKGSSSVEERVKAAERAVRAGYKTGFHFDPVIYSQGWEEEYRSVIDMMFSSGEIRENTVWISIGTLRYMPDLKQVAEQRFGDNLLYYTGDFFQDTDGKLRYPRELRTDIYKKMAGWIKAYSSSCWVYLCMEPGDLWREAGLRSWF